MHTEIKENATNLSGKKKILSLLQSKNTNIR